MQFSIDQRIVNLIKEAFNVEDPTPIVQKVIADWAANVIASQYQKHLTADEMLTAIEQKLTERKARIR